MLDVSCHFLTQAAPLLGCLKGIVKGDDEGVRDMLQDLMAAAGCFCCSASGSNAGSRHSSPSWCVQLGCLRSGAGEGLLGPVW